MRRRNSNNSDMGVLLLDVKQVANLLNIGVSTVWSLVKEGRFPEPIRLTAKCSRWRRVDIITWSETLDGTKQGPHNLSFSGHTK